MSRSSFVLLLPVLLLITTPGEATTPLEYDRYAGSAILVDIVAADTLAVHEVIETVEAGTREWAIGIVLEHLGEPLVSADLLESGLVGTASARDAGPFWIVTVSRTGMVVLDQPRMFAVDRLTGLVMDLVIEDRLEVFRQPAGGSNALPGGGLR